MILNSDTINVIFRLMRIKGIGSVQTNKFLLSIQNSNVAEIELQIRKSLNSSQIKEFENDENITDGLCSKFPIHFISLLDESYPNDLKRLLKTSSPPVLSYIGNIDLLKKQKVAFSGSRKVSEKGINITKDCVEQLSKKGITIVSGYAAGVDHSAHYTALEQGGTTIIILPEGINNFKIKKELKYVWDWDRVLIISEFFPSDKWMASRAMQRNNTIIGLSDIVVVIEAGETGGSLDAGLRTMALGKYLFVPLYGIVPDSAIGNSSLIQKGAFSIKMEKDSQRANLTKLFELLKISNKYELF